MKGVKKNVIAHLFAIVACGLLELSRQLPLNDEKHGYYEKVALELLQALAEKYTTVLRPESNGLLLHGVYDKKQIQESMNA